jgi:hypothetical protein
MEKRLKQQQLHVTVRVGFLHHLLKKIYNKFYCIQYFGLASCIKQASILDTGYKKR